MTIFDLRKKIIEALQKTSPTPQLDCDVLLSYFLKKERTWIFAHREFLVPEQTCNELKAAVQKRLTGLPIAYITGKKEFYGYEFFVTKDVLIPKPDTENLVDLALNVLAQKMALHPQKIPMICDMCTGSGCVALSILKTLQQGDGILDCDLPKITCVDISSNALEVAKKNAFHLSLEQSVRFVQSNLFEQIPYEFDLIVTNPPYVPHNEAVSLLKDGRSEPLLALDGDVDQKGDFSGSDDGLFLIRRLIEQSKNHLIPGGMLLMETGEYNAQGAAEILIKNGFSQVSIKKDMSGMFRNVSGIFR